MARKPKDWIGKAVNPENKGVFAAKAKRAGMSTLDYAKKVTKPESRASRKTKDQAHFAINVAGLPKKKSASRKPPKKGA